MDHIRASLELSTFGTPRALELAFTKMNEELRAVVGTSDCWDWCAQNRSLVVVLGDAHVYVFGEAFASVMLCRNGKDEMLTRPSSLYRLKNASPPQSSSEPFYYHKERVTTADTYLLVALAHLSCHMDGDYTSVFTTRIDAMDINYSYMTILLFSVNGNAQVPEPYICCNPGPPRDPCIKVMDLKGKDLKLVCKVGSCKFVIKSGDIKEWFVDGRKDAIVVPVGGQIHREIGFATGSSFTGLDIIPSGGLPAPKIIITRGPKYFKDMETEAAKQLGLTYENAITFARKKGVKHIALPAISCGCGGFPLDKAARIAVESVQKALRSAKPSIEVHFVIKDEPTWRAWVAATDLLAFWNYDRYLSYRCNRPPYPNSKNIEEWRPGEAVMAVMIESCCDAAGIRDVSARRAGGQAEGEGRGQHQKFSVISRGACNYRRVVRKIFRHSYLKKRQDKKLEELKDDYEFVNCCLGKPDLKSYSVMIVDEAYLDGPPVRADEGHQARFRQDLKVLTSSATLDAEKFSMYFDDAPIFTIPGRRHPMFTKGSGAPRRVSDGARGSGSRIAELIICPIYANLPSDLQAKIFEQTPPGARKRAGRVGRTFPHVHAVVVQQRDEGQHGAGDPADQPRQHRAHAQEPGHQRPHELQLPLAETLVRALEQLYALGSLNDPAGEEDGPVPTGPDAVQDDRGFAGQVQVVGKWIWTD
ncbi:hypothetical protein SELMODRAFT_412077 [Selaginella moellendorffii]|uniref:Macro domain-containing protein n=1 Tax=Selaginella moellendorffii TaxID=88036 RepID=D8RJZ5_SELML|nr:hypothetical protein SELMODRAFT_412077 [Selaginella moellendorffii]